jgi:hypothetical protein
MHCLPSIFLCKFYEVVCQSICLLRACGHRRSFQHVRAQQSRFPDRWTRRLFGTQDNSSFSSRESPYVFKRPSSVIFWHELHTPSGKRFRFIGANSSSGDEITLDKCLGAEIVPSLGAFRKRERSLGLSIVIFCRELNMCCR